ncbi:MAG: tRNA (cytidine(56)-2'-O)-methyltransferase [archaeon]
MKISVMRLSGRNYRDLRITTHCCLVARAFGAHKIYLDAQNTDEIGETVKRINTEFGGTFDVEYVKDPFKQLTTLKKEGKVIVHLTMYGETPQTVMKKIGTSKKEIVIVVGADKVPGKVYQLADYNVSVTRQPHSEVGALAVFLHYLQEGKEEELLFKGKKQVIPNPRGKTIH